MIWHVVQNEQASPSVGDEVNIHVGWEDIFFLDEDGSILSHGE
jgi:hypothetical protein